MKFRLLVSSDVHGTVMPYRYSDLKPCDHGFLKVKATMKKYIDENTVIIDNGDILEGSPLLSYHYHYEREKDNPMLKCTENFVDYFNIGNHDFNNGPGELFDYIRKSTGTCICGNIRYHDVPIGKEYVIHTLKDGTRLAFIGACTQYIPNWEKPENIEGFTFEDAYGYYRRMCRIVKEKERPDVLIAVYHGGYEKDVEGRDLVPDTGENEAYRIAGEIPEIDILVTGHLHLSLAGKIFGKPTSQTRPNGVEFALIDYDTDGKDGEVRLIPSTEEADPKELASFKEIEERVSKWLDSPMGRVKDIDLRIYDEEEARLHKHPLVSFLNQIEREVTGAQLASTALFSGAIGFPSEITMRDIVSTYVYPNTLVVLDIDGKILKEYLERCAEYFAEDHGKIVPSRKLEDFNYDMIDGIEYTIKVSSRPGERILSLMYQGKEIRDDDRFTLAVNNYRAGGGGNFLMLKKGKILKEVNTDMVTILSEYLLAHPDIHVEHQDNIHVIL